MYLPPTKERQPGLLLCEVCWWWDRTFASDSHGVVHYLKCVAAYQTSCNPVPMIRKSFDKRPHQWRGILFHKLNLADPAHRWCTIWVKETPKHNTFKHESNSSPARRKCAVWHYLSLVLKVESSLLRAPFSSCSFIICFLSLCRLICCKSPCCYNLSCTLQEIQC
jgi:hypothetical protein